ncbi:MAG: HAD family hydrolase [Eubacterium sp.]
MKSNYRLLAVDLDGTALNSKSQISKENIEAISRLEENGIKTAILTGRTFYEIPLEVRECKGIEYYIFSNGAGIRHFEKGLRYYSPIDKTIAAEVFKTLCSYNCFIELYSNGHPIVRSDEFNSEMLNYYNIDQSFIPVMEQTRFPVKDLEAVLYDDAYKIEMFDVFFKYENQRQACIEALMSKDYGFEITTSMSNNLEILKSGINKGTGLKKLCEIEHVRLEDIIVIGDSRNDITAFEVAHTKYAVSNACDELKALADKVICSNDENIMAYMERELL